MQSYNLKNAAASAILTLLSLTSFASLAADPPPEYSPEKIGNLIQNLSKNIESVECTNERKDAVGNIEKLEWKELANGNFLGEKSLKTSQKYSFNKLAFDGRCYQHASSGNNQLQISTYPPYNLHFGDKNPFIFLQFISTKKHPYPTFSALNDNAILSDFEKRISNITLDAATNDLSFDVTDGYDPELGKTVCFHVTLSKTNRFFPASWESTLPDGTIAKKYEIKEFGFAPTSSSSLPILYAKEYELKSFVQPAGVTMTIAVEETLQYLEESGQLDLLPLPDGVTREEFRASTLQQIRKQLSEMKCDNTIEQILLIDNIKFNNLSEESVYLDPSTFGGIHDLDHHTYIPIPCE